MKARRTLVMLGTLMLAATPLATYAGSREALDACLKSFVATYVPKDRVVRVHKQQPPVTPLALLTDGKNRYTIALSARGARSGTEIAHARCVASTKGDVIVMDTPDVNVYLTKADFAVVVTR